MIPKKDAQALAWMVNFAALLTLAPATYGLTAGDAVAVNAVVTPYETALATATNPGTRTPAAVAAKDAARAAAEVVIRPLAVQISLSAAVTAEDKTAIGVTVRKIIPTPIPAPTEAPELAVQKAIPGQLTLSARVPGSTSKAKPAGTIGLEVFRAVGTVAAVDPAQATYLGTFGKVPFRVSVDTDQVGKTLTFFARYVTRSGPAGVSQPGPFSTGLAVGGM